MRFFTLCILSMCSLNAMSSGDRDDHQYEYDQYADEEYKYEDTWYGPGYYYGIWFNDENDYWNWRKNHPMYPPNQEYYNPYRPIPYKPQNQEKDTSSS